MSTPLRWLNNLSIIFVHIYHIHYLPPLFPTSSLSLPSHEPNLSCSIVLIYVFFQVPARSQMFYGPLYLLPPPPQPLLLADCIIAGEKTNQECYQHMQVHIHIYIHIHICIHSYIYIQIDCKFFKLVDLVVFTSLSLCEWSSSCISLIPIFISIHLYPCICISDWLTD
jgi:hypothetical protein